MIWLWPRQACEKPVSKVTKSERYRGTITRCAPTATQFLATLSDSTKLNNLLTDSCDSSDLEIGGFTILYIALISLQGPPSVLNLSTWCRYRLSGCPVCPRFAHLLLSFATAQAGPSGSVQAPQAHVITLIALDWLWVLSRISYALAGCRTPWILRAGYDW